MHTNKPYPALLLLLMISLVFSACSATATVEPAAPTRTPSAAPTSTAAPTRTPAPTQTAPLPSATLTQTPTTTWTQSPSPTASPLPSLTPTPAPLSADGPWLVLSTDDLRQGEAATQFHVMNADGSGLQPLGLPAVPEKRAWIFLSEPRGPFLAFRTVAIDGSPLEIQADGIDDYVWVLKLPENRVVRKLPLLSEAAWRVIHAAQANDPEAFNSGYNLPTQLGLVINPDSFQWSPHGRYLTYSAALDGAGTDLYLYDTEKDTTRRLTAGRAGAQVWFWSPDGGTVFYTNGAQMGVAYVFPELTSPEGRYAVDLASGSERKLYQPSPIGETVIQASEQDFLVANSGFESDYSNLRRVNFKTGAIRTLFEGHFTASASDGQTILLSLDPSQTFSSVAEGMKPGLYRLNPASGQLDLLREGHFRSIGYHNSAQLFNIRETVGDSAFDVILFDSAGQETLRIPNTAWQQFSPDGQWIIAGNGNAWKVYNRSGEAQTEEFSGDTFWLNDSSGFYANSCVQGLQFYAESSAWQPVKVFPEACINFYLLQKP